MSENGTTRQLPLHEMHEAAGARFGPFAGYSMPLSYNAGVMQEHLHTREKAGLFDISHMQLLLVTGPDAATLIGDTLRSWGHDVPLDGPGAVGYVIPAYNEWIDVGGGVHLTGVEWNYRLGACPTTRSCQPQRTFDAAACVLRRVTGPAADEPAWSMVCLGGEAQPAGVVDDPVQQGQAFVAVRAMRQAPWDLDELWFAGYDANFVPAVGTGWLAVGSRTDVVDPRSAAGPAPSRGPVLPPERPAPVPTAASPRFTG